MSWQMRAVAGVVRLTRKRRFVRAEGGDALLARPKGSPSPPRRLTRRSTVTTRRVGGFDVHAVQPAGADPQGPVVVYLHGGAYVSEVVKQHWSLVEEVATTLGVEVLVPVYGLAPTHTALEALGLVLEVLEQVEQRPCHLVGDSAGGGLALIAAQQWVARGGAPLRGLTLLAPWLDLTMANPEIERLEPQDPWLARAALHRVAEVWADGLDLEDPRVSPLFGPVEGLPPVDLWVGSRDITLPDTRRLRDRVAEVGGAVTCHEVPGAIHVFPLLPVPEARRARDTILDTLAARLGVPARARRGAD